MAKRYIRNLGTLTALGLGLTAIPAQAATLVGLFSGNDCTGTFSQCYASQSGVNINGDFRSPVVAKYGGNESQFQISEISSNYPSIDGSEFSVGFSNSTVSFTYNPGLNDPEVHYFAIKQGDQYALYYDAAAILSDSVNLDGVGFSAGTDSFSHITFFNTGSTPAVPEPTTWAMMLLGFGFIGGAMRSAKRRNKLTVTYA